MPQVEALCVSEKKGEPKSPVEALTFRADYGIEGDAHAGDSHRQTSLLASEDIATVREKLPDIKPGAFAENVILSGLDINTFGLGTRLRLGGEVLLRVSQIGKVCHSPCAIGRATGDCIMPKQGVFARVIRGGPLAPGDSVSTDDALDRYRVAVITLSDRGAAGTRPDGAGPLAVELLDHVRVERQGVGPRRVQVEDPLTHAVDLLRLLDEIGRLADEDPTLLAVLTPGEGVLECCDRGVCLFPLLDDFLALHQPAL